MLGIAPRRALVAWVAGLILPPLGGRAAAQSTSTTALDAPRLESPGAVDHVQIRAKRTGAEAIEDSARAVDVLDLEDLRQRATSVGDVFRSAPGVTFRQAGGLGSRSTFTLNGLSGEQVPFFVDGIPLRLTGLPDDPSILPVGLIRRIELHKGVVPIELGADALGGAVNFRTYEPRETQAFVDYEYSSFETHRLQAQVSHAFSNTPLYLSARGFFDRSENDYEIEAPITNELGRQELATVEQFHDAFRNVGASLALGLQNVSWADTLEVRGFFNDQDDEIQNRLAVSNRRTPAGGNELVLSPPIGEAERGESSRGAMVRFERRRIGGIVDIDAFMNYTHLALDFVDLADVVYDWRGEIVDDRTIPGEITNGVEQTIHDHIVAARTNATVHLSYDQQLAFNVTPSYRRREIDRIDARRGPISREPAEIVELAAGASHRSQWLDRALENDLFTKLYAYHIEAAEVAAGLDVGSVSETTIRGGVGDALIWRPHDLVRIRASYELTTRLPEPVEVLGDGVFITSNPNLEPEKSHNVNLSAELSGLRTLVGEFQLGAWGFFREVEDQIFLDVGDPLSQYRNIASTRILGIEGRLGYRTRQDRIRLAANVTLEESRNTALRGPFERFEDDRIPNRPYLYASFEAGFRERDLFIERDVLNVYGYARYTREFFFSWESAGNPETKPVIPDQWAVDLGIGYGLGLPPDGTWNLNGAFEIHNLTDSDLFDFLGIPRPGRSYHAKLTMGFR